MNNRNIKFYVNPRDLEILNQAIFNHRKKITEMTDHQSSLLAGLDTPLDELGDYTDNLLACIKNLMLHHPYKPKTKD